MRHWSIVFYSCAPHFYLHLMFFYMLLQYQWMKKDMASVDRSKTPWLIFMGHRPMYTSAPGFLSVDEKFVDKVEPLLLASKVDLVLFGHVHNYERTCSIYKSQCMKLPCKDEAGIDTYDHSNYSAPVQAIIGMAGFSLDKFPSGINNSWSLSRHSEYGSLRAHATRTDIKLEVSMYENLRLALHTVRHLRMDSMTFI
ncbi:putative phosphodiesterase I [Rosa chinensis]|uniref:Putative phosphodiesterase I n=1 Tax=Rosa chinensis TaxID=74649 RepID=A0A2P6QVT6_ROSCH|nr:putative phosphodiesterase I [Rosa chinensis]